MLEIFSVLFLPYLGGFYISWKVREKGDKALMPNQSQKFCSSLYGLKVAMTERGGKIRDNVLGIKCF